MHDEPNLGGALRFLGLFVPVWWSWMIFTWYATAFDNDDVPYRVTLLAVMLSMLGLATSVGEVGVEPGATASFVLTYASTRLVITGLYLRTRRHVPASLRPFVGLYAAGNALGAAVWLSSLLVPEPGRYAVWAAGLFVALAILGAPLPPPAFVALVLLALTVLESLREDPSSPGGT